MSYINLLSSISANHNIGMHIGPPLEALHSIERFGDYSRDSCASYTKHFEG